MGPNLTETVFRLVRFSTPRRGINSVFITDNTLHEKIQSSWEAVDDQFSTGQIKKQFLNYANLAPLFKFKKSISF